jgi:hypothetical protein
MDIMKLIALKVKNLHIYLFCVYRGFYTKYVRWYHCIIYGDNEIIWSILIYLYIVVIIKS